MEDLSLLRNQQLVDAALDGGLPPAPYGIIISTAGVHLGLDRPLSPNADEVQQLGIAPSTGLPVRVTYMLYREQVWVNSSEAPQQDIFLESDILSPDSYTGISKRPSGRPHSGNESVNEIPWIQLTPPRYTCSKCQRWRRELKEGDIAQFGAD
ncbi:hypothetical protein UY3_01876 [Chelonia mydas]|uniref:Uncharacterized protein n=1 Tax=Chelonia mydas TaxID=8469 RepID=M7BYI2_CHEMY|nr:hypothetical protein UY3_01876 [Chelonia mydas]